MDDLSARLVKLWHGTHRSRECDEVHASISSYLHAQITYFRSSRVQLIYNSRMLLSSINQSTRNHEPYMSHGYL